MSSFSLDVFTFVSLKALVQIFVFPTIPVIFDLLEYMEGL